MAERISLTEKKPSMTFEVERSWITRIFSKSKVRTFSASEPSVAVLGKLCSYREFTNGPLPEEHESISLLYRWNSARVLAISATKGFIGFHFRAPILTIYFFLKIPHRRIIVLNRAYAVYFANLEGAYQAFGELQDTVKKFLSKRNK